MDHTLLAERVIRSRWYLAVALDAAHRTGHLRQLRPEAVSITCSRTAQTCASEARLQPDPSARPCDSASMSPRTRSCGRRGRLGRSAGNEKTLVMQPLPHLGCSCVQPSKPRCGRNVYVGRCRPGAGGRDPRSGGRPGSCAWTGAALERPTGHRAAPVERFAVRPGICCCPPHLEGHQPAPTRTVSSSLPAELRAAACPARSFRED